MNLAINRYKRQENFFLEKDRFKSIEIENKIWNIYDNANLSIHLGEACNANCQFCIAHLRYLNESKIYNKPTLEKEKYLLRLNNILNLLKDISPSVSITGGEPTIFEILPDVIDVLIQNNVRKRTMTTNGSHLLKNNKNILNKLIDYKLEHLNISRAHYDTNKNKDIMQINENLSDMELKEIISECKKNNINVRLSCALLKNGISTIEEIKKYMEWAETIDCHNVIFRQLMNFDYSITSGNIPEYCKQQTIQLIPLWEKMDIDKNFELYHSVLGYYYYVEIRKYNNMNVACEMADLNLIDKQIEKYETLYKKPLTFEMVFHPNGNLCGGWIEDQKIMSKYNGE